MATSAKVIADATMATETVLSVGDLLREAADHLRTAGRAADTGDVNQLRLCMSAAVACVETAAQRASPPAGAGG